MAAPRPPAFHLAHAAPGRVRLRAESPLDPERMAALAEVVAACGGVRRVVGRPNTGSLIVETGEAPAALLERLRAAGAMRPVPKPRPAPLRDAARLAALRADRTIAGGTEGALDLRTAFALALALAALYQIARGRMFGPAFSMALGAASLLDVSAAGESAAAGGDGD